MTIMDAKGNDPREGDKSIVKRRKEPHGTQQTTPFTKVDTRLFLKACTKETNLTMHD
jgi:hypothetical protein